MKEIFFIGVLLLVGTTLFMSLQHSTYAFKIKWLEDTNCKYTDSFGIPEISTEVCQWNYNQFVKFSKQNNCETFRECSWLGYKFKVN